MPASRRSLFGLLAALPFVPQARAEARLEGLRQGMISPARIRAFEAQEVARVHTITLKADGLEQVQARLAALGRDAEIEAKANRHWLLSLGRDPDAPESEKRGRGAPDV